jgi:hypothetical protein
MDVKRWPFANIAELGSGGSSQGPIEKIGLSKLHQAKSNDDVADNCLSDPKELQADAKAEKLAMAYDAFLIGIPVVLILKVILCIVAAQIDRFHVDDDIDSVSHLTIFLTKVNGQVRYCKVFSIIILD